MFIHDQIRKSENQALGNLSDDPYTTKVKCIFMSSNR